MKKSKQRSTRLVSFPLTIGSCAALLGVSPSLLRKYEDDGIVKPDRDSDGHRLYLHDDLKQIRAHRAALAAKR